LILENRHNGEILELTRVLRNGQEDILIKGTLPPHRPGPPLHIHHDIVEEGRVLQGTLSAEIDGKVFRVPAGQETEFPIGSVHTWWNDGDETLVVEGYARPHGDIDRYLQAAFEILNSAPLGRPPLFYMAHLSWRYRKSHQVLIIPLAVQAILFPVVIFLGTLLGRYRGTDWPGCPERCTGAPSPK
jgi:mannose-6-phosphate isomerase-like protein (cupin superfamily)